MPLILGDIVKLKDYSRYMERKDEFGIFIENFDGQGNVKIRWIKDDYEIIVHGTNVEKKSVHRIKTYFDKLKVGDLVVSNGDGSRARSKWIYGEIGEIGTVVGVKCFYLWNNTATGTRGQKIPKGWKCSWLIRATSTGNIVKVGVKEIVEIKEPTKCFNCDEILNKSDMLEGSDGELYCEECFHKLFAECHSCNTLFAKEDMQEDDDGDLVCDECFSENYFHCEGCECAVHNDNGCYSERDGANYCEECFGERYFHCRSCGEDFSRDDMCGDGYCSECYSERFATCEECENEFRRDDLIYNEDDDTYWCAECSGQTPAGKIIHEYGYKPEAILYKEKWEEELYMGIELEVQRDRDFKKVAETLWAFLNESGNQKYFYFKHDGSLHDKGFEIVSHPCTLGHLHKNVGFNKMLKWLKSKEVRSEEGGECGLHVHLSRAFFEDLDIAKLRIFFNKNKDQIGIFSRRTDFHYCKFETNVTDKDIINNDGQDGDRYWAVNTNSSRETIEIRVFRGTLDPITFMATLQFVDAISHFVKKVGITSLIIGEREYYKNSWKLFIDWAKEQNKYGVMLKYMEAQKICV